MQSHFYAGHLQEASKKAGSRLQCGELQKQPKQTGALHGRVGGQMWGEEERHVGKHSQEDALHETIDCLSSCLFSLPSQ